MRADAAPFVITHGEPHPGNVLWSAQGPLLLDWDTALLAPAGRDLWMLADESRDEPSDVALYRLWWELGEVAGYVTEIREPHTDTEDVREAWTNLQHYVARLSRSPE